MKFHGLHSSITLERSEREADSLLLAPRGLSCAIGPSLLACGQGSLRFPFLLLHFRALLPWLASLGALPGLSFSCAGSCHMAAPCRLTNLVPQEAWPLRSWTSQPACLLALCGSPWLCTCVIAAPVESAEFARATVSTPNALDALDTVRLCRSPKRPVRPSLTSLRLVAAVVSRRRLRKHP